MSTKHFSDDSTLSFASMGISILILNFALVGCGTTLHLPSHWPEKQIVVDGKNSEWERTYLIADNKLVVSFVNDSSFMYLLLATNDRQLAMSMVRGLTVWIDSKGGDDKTFGIHYPMGGRFSREMQASDRENEDPSIDPGEQMGMPATEMEILGPGKDDRHRMQIMESGGIQATYRLTVNSIVYELKVPFMHGDQYPFAVRSKIGDVIGLGLETSQGRMQGGGRESRGRNTGIEPAEGGEEGGYEGRGMRGGGRGGEGAGYGQGGSRGSASPLDIWMQVKLVSKDSLAN